MQSLPASKAWTAALGTIDTSLLKPKAKLMNASLAVAPAVSIVVRKCAHSADADAIRVFASLATISNEACSSGLSATRFLPGLLSSRSRASRVEPNRLVPKSEIAWEESPIAEGDVADGLLYARQILVECPRDVCGSQKSHRQAGKQGLHRRHGANSTADNRFGCQTVFP